MIMVDVIITAGGTPQPDEALYAFTQGSPKALLDIAGRPMIQRVLDAFNGARSTGRVVLVGLSVYHNFEFDKPLEMMEDQGGMLNNIKSALQLLSRDYTSPRPVIVCSSDIPCLTSEMVDWMAATLAESEHDLYYNVVSRQVMEARYPNSRRTYVKLRDLEVCGGDMNAILSSIATDNPVWDKLIETRKSPVKQAALLGLDTLLNIILHRLSLADAERVLSKRIGLRGRVINSPYAELGMDVDKPNQLELVRADLARAAHA